MPSWRFSRSVDHENVQVTMTSDRKRRHELGGLCREPRCRCSVGCEFTTVPATSPSTAATSPSHPRNKAIGGFTRWCDQRCRPERHFAVSSVIRHPDYLPDLA